MKKPIFLTLFLLVAAIGASAVTFKAKVPSGTKKCYVCGDFNGWDAGSALEMSPAETDLFTLTLSDVTEAQVANGYKYLCGQDWTYVEKDASGGEISNRTSIGNPDVVGSWYNQPEWDVESAEIQVNGYPRLIKVYLPEGYGESTESYPVIYYNTVQQRYNDAGNDADQGDYFFGPKSWNAHSTMESLRDKGGKPYIMVQICSFLAENTPEHNPDFIGTGGAESYLKAFAEELMSYVESKWRVKKGAENTIITGADYGALFSLYASLKRPDLFGTCIAMSPMLWINEGYFENLASQAAAGQAYYLSAGSLEPAWMQSDASNLASRLDDAAGVKGSYTLFAGATHDDEAWGKEFGDILAAAQNETEPVATAIFKAIRKADSDTPFASRTYTLYGGDDKNNLKKIGAFTYTEDYRKKGSDTPVAAFVNTNSIGLEYKGTYYWNIACGEDASAGWLLPDVKDIGFSSKKSEVSWQNVAIFEDGTTSDIAAHSKGFKLIAQSGEIMMTRGDDYTANATVTFPNKDKSFKINFGSVNSASDMGAVTPELKVSDNCVEAFITYDFNLNKVTVKETQTGESIDNLAVEYFTATPSVCNAGTDILLEVGLSGAGSIEVTGKKNSTQSVTVTSVKDNDRTYHINLNNAQEGLYTFTVTLVVGTTKQTNAAEINVKVLPSGKASEKTLAVNAYRNIDWNTTQRYKANFHTHTSQSFDTQFTTAQVVDRYQGADYKILSLTDHDANSYPWNMFSLYNSFSFDRNPEEMGMLAIPGNELSKDRRNNWSEKTGGEFNHHNDFFTGRKGQEFMSLRESYAYTQALGGMQIINHPGQYWNLSTEYKAGEKNSPEWHAENFRLYDSLIGLEVYNQGNRRPNDRILWDQILTITMPQRPVWGYSCDDTHTAEQYFRNYEYMLMDELTVDELKEAMRNGSLIFSYEYTGSGKALAPHVDSIEIDETNGTITINSDDADTIEWIYSTHRTSSSASSTKSTVIGLGNKFNYKGFQGSYVRARLINKYGETALQPFGFANEGELGSGIASVGTTNPVKFSYNSADQTCTATCDEGIVRITLVNADGIVAKAAEYDGENNVILSTADLRDGVYVAVVLTSKAAYTAKFIK